MDTPQAHAPKEMNWADYWDSLTDEYFSRRASAELPPAAEAPRVAERVTQTVTRRATLPDPA